MSEQKSWKDEVKDFVLMLGGTGVVIGGIWGFYCSSPLCHKNFTVNL